MVLGKFSVYQMRHFTRGTDMRVALVLAVLRYVLSLSIFKVSIIVKYAFHLSNNLL